MSSSSVGYFWYLGIFAIFQKIGYFWIQLKVVYKQLVTESVFIFVDIFQYFRETPNLLSLSYLPANRCYSPSKTTWFGHFWPKKRRYQTLLHIGFSGKIGKIRYLRRCFNRMTISYKCGTWLILFVL